ncbi:Undecaprenyl-diphosphatase [uncultured archaeon]|nr:Undecaprenyl-diphosphatase [uncultured archaeon]
MTFQIASQPQYGCTRIGKMDIASLFISLFGLVREPVRAASIFLNDPVGVVLFSAALVLAVSHLFREEKRLPFMVASVIIAFLLGYSLKLLIAEARPCVLLPGKIACPPDYSLPSLHALLAFTLAVAAIGNRSFPIYLIYALFIAFSRVYLGVHTITDVASGLALAFLACVLAEMLWKAMGWELPMQIHLKHDGGRLRK